MKKSNIVNKNVRVNDEVRSKIVRNTAENSNADNQTFRNDITNSNLLNSKARNIHARIKSSTRNLNRLIEIENSLSSVERSTNTTTLTTIDEISIEKE